MQTKTFLPKIKKKSGNQTSFPFFSARRIRLRA